MSITTAIEYWNEAPDPAGVHVVMHSRKRFYNSKNITWFEFVIDGLQLHELGHENIIPDEFLRIKDTDYYQFDGPAEDAIPTLTDANFTLILKGKDV